MHLARFYLVILSTVWKETCAYSLNGIHLILRCLPNHQIKATAKYTMYMVISDMCDVLMHTIVLLVQMFVLFGYHLDFLLLPNVGCVSGGWQLGNA